MVSVALSVAAAWLAPAPAAAAGSGVGAGASVSAGEAVAGSAGVAAPSVSVAEALQAQYPGPALAALASSASGLEAGSGPVLLQVGGFADTGEDAYYSEAVAALAEAGVFAGTGCDRGFCPGEPIDRKTMAVWTVRVLDGVDPPAVSQSRFGDVDTAGFHAPFIERMAQLGVTSGCGDGTNFCPDRSVTRAQMAVFLSRAYNLPDGPDPGFGDVPADAWYGAEVAKLAESGITVGCGDGTDFCPGRATTRAQMATFLWRAEQHSAPAVEVPTDGRLVAVPERGSFVAEFESVTVAAPAGALSASARVSLSETSIGAGDVVEGEQLATTPIAMSVTGADIVKPVTLRFTVDTSSLTATGVVPAWWSKQLDSWVPLDAHSVVIGDGEVVVRADLADAQTASAVTALGPAGFSGSAGPTVHALAVPLVVIGLIVFVGVAVGVAAVALTSDTVHDVLKRFFGLVVDAPRCSFAPPSWVDRVSNSDEALAHERARLHICGERTGDDLRVKVANNRNYGIQLRASQGAYPVAMPGGNNPAGLLDIAIKEVAEELLGETYLWPLSQSEFLLPPQGSDWSSRVQATAASATVDGVRIGLDLLKVALPGIEAANNAGIVTCIRSLMDQVGRRSVDFTNHLDWMSILGPVASCFTPQPGSPLPDNVRKGIGHVKNALGWVSTAQSAAKWGLTLGDAIKDARLGDASITVDVKPGTAVPTPPPDTINHALDGGGIISAGFAHSCGRTFQYRYITCWGNDDLGQADAPSGTFTAVSAGDFHTCGLRTDGTVTCWGTNIVEQLDAPSGTFSAISAGRAHTCGIKTDGTITCWGSVTTSRTFAPSGSFSAVSAGDFHTCGIKADATVTCWGDNDHRQRDAPPGNFSAVSAGALHTCGLRTDATITCWGAETNAPSGSFAAVSAGGTAEVSADGVVSAGSLHTCALRTTGAVTCWGNNDATPPGGFAAVSAGGSHACGLRTDGTVTCWGDNQFGQTAAPQLQFASVVAPTTGTDDSTTLSAVSVDGFHSCGVKTDATITCWGQNRDGQTDAPSGTYDDVTTGLFHSCGLKSDGTIGCWGSWTSLSYDNSIWPDLNSKGDGPSGVFSEVSAGERQTCALKTDGTIICWGRNDYGQAEPPGGAFSAVSAGGFHSCALRPDATLGCWGDNRAGQRNAPSGTFSAVSAGGFHLCGLRTDGTITCWGWNRYGQRNAPSGTFSAVSAGALHSCGLSTDGTITCWGRNDYGQRNAPIGTFSAVSAGFYHSCGLRTDGTVTCWGRNDYGQTDPPSG